MANEPQQLSFKQQLRLGAVQAVAQIVPVGTTPEELIRQASIVEEWIGWGIPGEIDLTKLPGGAK